MVIRRVVIRRQETPLGRVTEEKLRCVRIPLLRKNNRVKNTEKSATYHQRNPFREDLKNQRVWNSLPHNELRGFVKFCRILSGKTPLFSAINCGIAVFERKT